MISQFIRLVGDSHGRQNQTRRTKQCKKNPIIIKTNTEIDTCKGLVLVLQKSHLWKIVIKKKTKKTNDIRIDV